MYGASVFDYNYKSLLFSYINGILRILPTSLILKFIEDFIGEIICGEK
jgi:hypothetical protein